MIDREKAPKDTLPCDSQVRAAWVRTVLSEIPLPRLAHFLKDLQEYGGIVKCGCGGGGHHCAFEVKGIEWDSLPVEQVERVRADTDGIRGELSKQLKVHLERMEIQSQK